MVRPLAPWKVNFGDSKNRKNSASGGRVPAQKANSISIETSKWFKIRTRAYWKAFHTQRTRRFRKEKEKE